MLTVGSLFSGIGGLELGLERAGMKTIWQVERDPFARKILEKNFPGVPCYEDIRTIDAGDLVRPDVLCGGFPCQPHSSAGLRRGSADERDLWDEFVRVIRGTRPRWVVGENVTGLLTTEDGRFFGRVLRDLAGLGFDAEWSVLSACAVGAPHTRERVFIVAHANGLDGQAGLGFQQDWQAAVQRCAARAGAGLWVAPPPPPDNLADGLPKPIHETRCLGNAVSPGVSEHIGRLIASVEAQRRKVRT